MDFLKRMRWLKLAELDELKSLKLPERERELYNPMAFLKKRPVIAEVKLASPSRGRIAHVDPVEKALIYEAAGAGAISVLTDRYSFSGSWDHLKRIGDSVNLPILCKDFILSEIQIDMAFSYGADMILLINAFLSPGEAVKLSRYAKSRGLFVLFEIHSEDELKTLKDVQFDMLGVNSRDLQTLEVDTQKAESVLISAKKSFPFVIAESGIKDVLQAKRLIMLGADALLIGEALMRTEDPAKFIKEINHVCEGLWDKKC